MEAIQTKVSCKGNEGIIFLSVAQPAFPLWDAEQHFLPKNDTILKVTGNVFEQLVGEMFVKFKDFFVVEILYF